MHKAFYVSGLLYHLPSQQILLHQPIIKNRSASEWSMLTGLSKNQEKTQDAFRAIVEKFLGIKINAKKINHVYDYFLNDKSSHYFIVYVEIKTLKKFSPSRKGNFAWFNFKQAKKLAVNNKTKQDIIVSERVISAKARSLQPPPPSKKPNL